MRFTLPILLTTGILVAAGATSAQAATSHTHPQTPPSSVMTTGTASSVTLAWSAPKTSPAAVAAYTIKLSPSRGHALLGLKVVRPAVRSVTYSHLTAGKTYSLSISATSRKGVSTPVTVTYVAKNPAPAVAPQTLFAIDDSGTLVKAPATGGSTTPVQAGAVAYDVNAAGDAFVLTDDSVVAVSASGHATTLRSGVTGASQLQVDAKNNVYLLEGNAIVELPAGASSTRTVLTSPESIAGWTVSSAGTVSALEGDAWSETLTVATAPAGAAATSRTVDGDAYGSAYSAQFDEKGTAFFTDGSTGASGAKTAKRIAAGASTATISGSGNVVQGVGLTDSDYLLQSATWCPVPSLNSGSCVPDLTVANIQVTSDTGVTTTVPVTGLTTGRAKYSSGAATAVTSDTAGTIFVTEATGVFTYASTGGAPTPVLTGSYSDIKLNR